MTVKQRAAREAYTALVLEHQRELEERGIPTGTDAGPVPTTNHTADGLKTWADVQRCRDEADKRATE